MNGININYTARQLKKGEIIIFGSDTINGMGCMYNNKKALKKMYELKKRPLNKPFILLFSSKKRIFDFFEYNVLIEKLINKFMPGALTIIAKPKKDLEKYLIKNGFSAFRISKRKSLIKLIDKLNNPIAQTSVNISGKKVLKNRNEIKSIFKDVYFFNNLSSYEIPSTIIKIRNNKIIPIRNGKIQMEDILEIA